MKILFAVAALSAALSLSASAEEKPPDKADAQVSAGQKTVKDEKPPAKADAGVSAGQKTVKSEAEKLESDTNKSLEEARKSGRKFGQKLEKGANDAAKAFRQKLGTEK